MDNKPLKYSVVTDNLDFIPDYNFNDLEIAKKHVNKLFNDGKGKFFIYDNENDSIVEYTPVNSLIFNHKCIKCGAQFTSHIENDQYCGGCEQEIEDTTGESPIVESVKNDESNQEWDDLPEPPSPADTVSEVRNGVAFEVSKEKLAVSVADSIQNHIKTAKSVKKSSKKRGFDIDQELEPFIFKNPKKETKLVFVNRSNTEYKVVKEDLLHIGIKEGFESLWSRGLDPRIDKSKSVFGIAKKIQPLNKTITEMKQNFDNAVNTAKERLANYEKAKADAQAQAQAQAQANAQANAQGGKESANN